MQDLDEGASSLIWVPNTFEYGFSSQPADYTPSGQNNGAVGSHFCKAGNMQ